MSKLSSGKAPSKKAEGEVTLPFSVGKVLAIAPAFIIALIACGIYFSGIVQLMLANRELQDVDHEAKAIDYFNWALSVNPNLGRAYSDRATTLMNIETRKGSKADYSAARRDIANAVRLEPNNYDYFENSMKIEHAAHNFTKEIAGYERLIALRDYMREYLLNDRAGLLYIVGDFKKARADRDSIIKVSSANALNETPSDPGTNYEYRAEQYRYFGEIDKAIRDYEVVAQKSNPTSDQLMHLAYLYQNSGRTAQALKIYSKVIEVDDKNDDGATQNAINARYRRANLYLKFGEKEKALADADYLLKHDEESMQYQVFHAKVLDFIGRKAAAEKERKAALENLKGDPNNYAEDADAQTKADAYATRADYYASVEQWKNALKNNLISISLDPSSANYSECARMYAKLGDYDNAIKFYTKAITPSSDDDDLTTAYNGLAKTHLSQKKPALAVEDCNKAIMTGTRDGESSDLRGKAYRALGKNDLAKIDENEALGLEFSPLPDLQ